MNSNITQIFSGIQKLGMPIMNCIGKDFHLHFSSNSQLYNQLLLIIGAIMLACYLMGLFALLTTLLGWSTYHFKLKENEDNQQFKTKKKNFLISGIISTIVFLLLPSLVLLICGAVASFSYNPAIG